ncbi:MAG: anaerobic ribonucleoside-triphosphate reductase, partial [Planctomycetes bacterium]|nr:anaerobic ribonucleoside-triphosphate reductase [Planctomycetota bacterium]
RRLAKIDLKRSPDAADFMRGDLGNDEVYYTNSVHLRPDAPDGIVDRIMKQAKFHSLIESGAIIHAFIGESRPSAGAIASLVRNTFEKTKAAQLTISPEFTVCRSCHKVGAGISEKCPHCGAVNMQGIRRIDETEMSEISRPGWDREAIRELGRIELAAGCCK